MAPIATRGGIALNESEMDAGAPETRLQQSSLRRYSDSFHDRGFIASLKK